jgi:hypothetical protein
MTHEHQSDVSQARRWSFYPLPDALLFLFLLCIARQYLWILGGSFARNVIAYAVSAAVAGIVVWRFGANRGTGWEGTESALDPGWHRWQRVPNSAGRFSFSMDWAWFAIIVAPLLVFFFLRAPFPSLDFDNLNYHLVNAQRALRGWPMIDGDFFPGTLLMNPAPDMVFGVARALVGYRLAPIVNVMVLLWLAHLLNEIFGEFIKGRIPRYFAVLFAIAADHILYLVNLYMIDLFSLPLLLSALLMTVRFARAANKANALMKIALWLGIAVAFKVTNACFALPIMLLLLVELWKLYGTRQFPKPTQFAYAVIIAVLPSAFFLGYMYHQTGNPFFPYLNNIFHSDLMTQAPYRDFSHGPENLWQKILWPVVSFIYPERLSAMSPPLYTGRINIGFVLACALLFSRSASNTLKKICFAFVLSSFLWSFVSGDVRYALLNEVLGGVLCVFVLTHVLRLVRSLTQRRERFRARLAFALYGMLLVVFSSLSILFGLTHVECFSTDKYCDRAMQPYFMMTYAKPTYMLYDHVFRGELDTTPSGNYFREASWLLRDRDAQDFLPRDLQTQLSKVDVWINCYDATSGVMTVAAPDKPMISVAKFLDLFDYMQAGGAQRRARASIERQRGKRMYTLVLADRLEQARTDLGRAPLGLRFGSSEAVSIPLYSPFTRTEMMLVEVLPDSLANQ